MRKLIMVYLVLGLLLFLGTHSLRLGGEARRDALRLQWGEAKFKTAYTLLSGAGLALLVYGFGLAREAPTVVWTPPAAMRHVAFLLMLLSMVLLAATYVPGNAIRSRLHHPMVLSVKVWALAHLLANGTLAHMVLFGGFLAWSVLVFKASRRRDRELEVVYPAGGSGATVLTIGIGILLWALLLGWLHGVLIGVRLIG
jgi:uncharacterized membrane protein